MSLLCIPILKSARRFQLSKRIEGAGGGFLLGVCMNLNMLWYATFISTLTLPVDEGFQRQPPLLELPSAVAESGGFELQNTCPS